MVGLIRRKRQSDDRPDYGPPHGPAGCGEPGEPPCPEYEEQSSFVAEEMDFLRIFMSLTEEERILIGHDFTSFIKSCTFRGNDCLKERYVRRTNN